MGVSFKVARVGTRHHPKLPPPDPAAGAGDKAAAPDAVGDAPAPKRTDREVTLLGLDDGFASSIFSANSERNLVGPEHEASFSLNLFPDGFSIGKPTEGMLLPSLGDVPNFLHPYDRASKTLFSAIEYGLLPGDILDDIPCKYFNGTLICEVRDYRSCASKFRNKGSSGDNSPKIQKVCLRMGMENIVKDMPSISDGSWTYSDLLQAESQIVKALQPILTLGMNQSLDKLRGTVPKQLDLGICKQRLMNKQHDVLEVNHKSTNLDMPINGYVESSKSQTSVAFGNDSAHCARYAISRNMPLLQQNDGTKDVTLLALPLVFQPSYNLVVSCPLSVSSSVAVASNFVLEPDQNLRDSCIGPKNPAYLHGKKNRSKTQPTSKANGKRTKQEQQDLVSLHLSTNQRDNLLEQGSQWKVTLAQKQQETQNMQHLSFHDQNSSQQQQRSEASIERIQKEAQMSYLYLEHVQHIVKEEPSDMEILCRLEVEKDIEDHAPDVVGSEKSSEQLSPSSVRALPLQIQGSSTGQSIEKCPKKRKASRKRKLSQGSQVLAGGSDSQVSKGENHRIFSGANCSALPTVAAVKDKAASMPAASIGTGPVISSSSSSLIQESRLTLLKKQKSKALNKVTSQSMSGIGSPACFGDMSVSFRSKGSTFGTGLLPPSATSFDPSTLERFSKIKMVCQRHGLNGERNKIDEHPATKSLSNCSLPPARLIMPEDTEECRPLTENLCMSKYLIGGSRNAHKTRKITFVLEGISAGNDTPLLADKSQCKLVLTESEEPGIHEVGAEVIFGDEQCFHVALLHNPHHADLFAAQFISLMEREGYKLVDDQLQPLPSCIRGTSCDSAHIGSAGVTSYPCTTLVTGQPLKPISPPDDSISDLNPWQFPHNIPMPPRASTSSLNLSSQRQLDIVSHPNSMQQQRPQVQSSLSFVWNNPPGNANMDMSNTTPNSIARPNTNMQMGSTTPDSIAHLNLLRLQQNKWQNCEQQAISQNKMATLGTTYSITGTGEHESGLSMCQNNDHPIQIPGFSFSSQQFPQRGNSETPTAVPAKLRQAANQGVGVINGSIPVGSSTHGIFGMMGDGSLLDQVLGRSCMDQFQYGGKMPTIFSNMQYLNVNTNNYDQMQQQNMHPRGMRQPLQKLQQQLVSQHDLLTVNQSIRQLQQQQRVFPQHHDSWLTPMSPKQLSSGSATQQVNTGIANVGSPQVISQTGASSGSVANSPMLQCPQKQSYHGKGL